MVGKTPRSPASSWWSGAPPKQMSSYCSRGQPGVARVSRAVGGSQGQTSWAVRAATPEARATEAVGRALASCGHLVSGRAGRPREGKTGLNRAAHTEQRTLCPHASSRRCRHSESRQAAGGRAAAAAAGAHRGVGPRDLVEPLGQRRALHRARKRAERRRGQVRERGAAVQHRAVPRAKQLLRGGAARRAGAGAGSAHVDSSSWVEIPLPEIPPTPCEPWLAVAAPAARLRHTTHEAKYRGSREAMQAREEPARSQQSARPPAQRSAAQRPPRPAAGAARRPPAPAASRCSRRGAPGS